MTTNIKHLMGLHPAFALRVWAVIGMLAEQGISVRVLFGYRSHEEQAILRDRWKRGQGGKAVAAGLSWHQYGLAVDMVPYLDADHDAKLDHSELDWNTLYWKQYAEAAFRVGVIWGGAWKIKDKPHLEWHPGFPQQIKPSMIKQLTNIRTDPDYFGPLTRLANHAEWQV